MLDKIFNMENPFWTFVNKLADVVILELLWLLASLPLITVGAASAAFWHNTLRIVEDQEGRMVSGFFTAFRKSFKTGTAVWLIQLAAGLWLVLDVYICLKAESVIAVFLLGMLCVLSAVFLLASLFLYPLIGRFDFSVKKILGNSVFLCIRHFPHALCMLILAGAAFFASYHFIYAITLLPALAFYLDAMLINWIFSHYMQNEDQNKQKGATTP